MVSEWDRQPRVLTDEEVMIAFKQCAAVKYLYSQGRLKASERDNTLRYYKNQIRQNTRLRVEQGLAERMKCTTQMSNAL